MQIQGESLKKFPSPPGFELKSDKKMFRNKWGKKQIKLPHILLSYYKRDIQNVPDENVLSEFKNIGKKGRGNG